MSKDMKICWSLLDSVSRSFSLCIKILPNPIDEQMNLAYLIYRLIDTIEDSSAPLDVKKAQFDQFINLLSMQGYNEQETLRVRQDLLESLDYTYEKPLLENLDSVVKEYYKTPVNARSSIRKWGAVMAEGMYEFQTKEIKTFKDQDQYSYYVAGVVGYLLNDLFYHNEVISESVHKKLMEHSKRFGLALQKVNILRDVAHDIKQNRFYWPNSVLSKHKLDYNSLLDESNREKAMQVLHEEIDDALKYLYSGMYYVVSLPSSAIRVRMFCLIPLFMAIESFAKCVNNSEIFNSQSTVKISRIKVNEIVAKASMWGSSDDKLLRWFFNSVGIEQVPKEKSLAPDILLAKARLN